MLNTNQVRLEKPFTLAAQKRKLQAVWRARRMAVLADRIELSPHLSVLDIGGLPDLWEMTPNRPRVTLLNLPGAFRWLTREQRSDFDLIEGNIFDSPELPASFDIAFSNSVLEHVGAAAKQEIFARIVRRAPAYWIQVPSPRFPIEQHCHALFWWQRGDRLRERAMKRWSERGDALSGPFMRNTFPIDQHRLQKLFPDATLSTLR